MNKKILLGILVLVVITSIFYIYYFKSSDISPVAEPVNKVEIPEAEVYEDMADSTFSYCDETNRKLILIDPSDPEEWVRYINDEYHYSLEFPHKKICLNTLDVGFEKASTRGTSDTSIMITRNKSGAESLDDDYIEPTIDLELKYMLSNFNFSLEKRYITEQGIEAVIIITANKNQSGEVSKMMFFLKDKVIHRFEVNDLDEATTNRILESIRFEDIKE